jgi:DNA mismatch endonuclease, patch repair protein
MDRLPIWARAPAASSPEVRRRMQSVLRKDTAPETLLRSGLHRLGLRFRKDYRPIPSLRCTADVVFPRQKVCVFVDGCFWHGCAVHHDAPKTNAEWWAEKVSNTARRDRQRTTRLRDDGWKVIRLWEHDLAGDNLGRSIKLVAAAVRVRARGLSS